MSKYTEDSYIEKRKVQTHDILLGFLVTLTADFDFGAQLESSGSIIGDMTSLMITLLHDPVKAVSSHVKTLWQAALA